MKRTNKEIKALSNKAHILAESLGWEARSIQEPSTGYWEAFIGPSDKQGTIWVLGTEPGYDSEAEALADLFLIVKEKIWEWSKDARGQRLHNLRVS
jgi:hypothetical protein